MKNLLFTIALTFMSLSATLAQTEKGNFLVGAQVGNLTVGTQNGINTLSARISPVAGYFVANRFAVGLGLPTFISRIRFDNNSRTGTYRTSQFGVTPFLRYYFNLPNPAFKPYVGVSAGYAVTSISQTGSALGPSGKTTGDGFTYGIQLGLAYFVSNRASVDFSMNLADGDGGISQSIVSSNPGLGVSTPRVLSLNLGFQLFFGK